MTIVAVHQPNFLPWLGYFIKITRADVFVFLDTVQFTKGGFSNRARIRRKTGESWLTVPLRAKSKKYPLLQVEINGRSWLEDVGNKLADHYGRAPFFDEVMPLVSQWLSRAPMSSLAALNQHLIAKILELLEIRTACRVASEMAPSCLRKNERIEEIVKAAGGDTYLSGTGATAYNAEEYFTAHGIRLIYNEVRIEPYPQVGVAFIPNLSVIDVLMNIGPAGTAELIIAAVRDG